MSDTDKVLDGLTMSELKKAVDEILGELGGTAEEFKQCIIDAIGVEGYENWVKNTRELMGLSSD